MPTEEVTITVPFEQTLFQEFDKIPRLNREICVTEKIDGANVHINITDDFQMFTGSRTRYITPDDDYKGFARWAQSRREELMLLGPGHHYGEWWGSGIARGYGLLKGEKRFSLFNVHKWTDEVRPACCHVVPVLYRGPFKTSAIDGAIDDLRRNGSRAVPGFMRPEGVIVFHTAAHQLFKVTLEKDESPKSLVDAAELVTA